MLLGNKNIETNSVRVYTVDFDQFLREGTHIVTATVSSSSLTTTASAALTPDARRVHITVTTGAVTETLTLSLHVVDTLGQIVNDTIGIVVVTP